MAEPPAKKPDVDAAGAETAPVVHVPSRGKATFYLTLAAGFVFGGMVLLGAMPETPAAVGWLAIAFGLVGGGAALATRAGHSTHLALDETGLTHRHLWRDTHVAWEDIRKIGVFQEAGGCAVVYDLPEDHPAAQGRLARWNRGVCGYSHSIPDTYAMDPFELAEELEAWRTAYAGPLEESPPREALPAGEGPAGEGASSAGEVDTGDDAPPGAPPDEEPVS